MALANSAIELPTNRQSRFYTESPNVHDPNYIPVLNGAEIRVDFSQPSFSALPSIPTPHITPAQASLKRSKSGSAPEIVLQTNSSRNDSRRRTAKSKAADLQELAIAHSPIDPESSSSDVQSASNTNSDASSHGAAAILEEHVFVIPGNTGPKKEEMQFPTVPHSARSSISSVATKKSFVPTSRFNSKQPSLPSLPQNALQSIAQSAQSSRVASPELNRQTSQITLKSTALPSIPMEEWEQPYHTPRSTPLPATPMEETAAFSSSSGPRVQAMKSTASERRARALHSHPSNISMNQSTKSQANSVVDETDEIPLVKKLSISESRPASTRSRSQSICNSQPQTPAPNTPLPDLPPGAKTTRPPTREKPPPTEKTLVASPLPNPFTLPSPNLLTARNEHLEMAEFMTTKKLTIFRRFDEVHVRLLLHLQDEISALEKGLQDVEEAGPGRPDDIARKANIMRELRKALAEYGETNSKRFPESY